MILEHFFNLMQCICRFIKKKKKIVMYLYTVIITLLLYISVTVFFKVCLLTENKYTLFMGKISELYRKENCFT